jgi:hypothetical protein
LVLLAYPPHPSHSTKQQSTCYLGRDNAVVNEEGNKTINETTNQCLRTSFFSLFLRSVLQQNNCKMIQNEMTIDNNNTADKQGNKMTIKSNKLSSSDKLCGWMWAVQFDCNPDSGNIPSAEHNWTGVHSKAFPTTAIGV